MSYENRSFPTGYIPTPQDQLAKGLARYGQTLASLATADRSRSVSLPVPVRLWQGWVGCCVGATYALGMSVLDAGLPLGDRFGFSTRSTIDVWARAKVLDGSRGNVGVTMHHGGDAALLGACSQDDLPLPPDGREDLLDPDTAALGRVDNVLAHRLVNPSLLVDGCIAALQEGKPVAIGLGMDTNQYYRAGDQNGVITARGTTLDFWHAELLTDYDAEAGLLILTGSWLDWLPPQIRLASPRMDKTKVALTLDAFRECVFEARVLDREAVVRPQPNPKTGLYTLRPQLWQPPLPGQDWRITSQQESQVWLPEGERAWVGTAVVNPDGRVVYPSVFQPLETSGKGEG